MNDVKAVRRALKKRIKKDALVGVAKTAAEDLLAGLVAFEKLRTPGTRAMVLRDLEQFEASIHRR
jgi:hypothetical protein